VKGSETRVTGVEVRWMYTVRRPKIDSGEGQGEEGSDVTVRPI